LNIQLAIAPLTAELARGGDLQPLLEGFLVFIVPMVGAQAGAVRLLTDDGLSMRLVAEKGLPSHVRDTERLVQRHCGMCGSATHADMIGWVEDVKACGRSDDHSYFGLQCKSILAISLIHEQQVLGIYNLFFFNETSLDPQMETLLRYVGQLLGLALHNARNERVRMRLTVMKERQDLVNEVHDALAQTLAYVRMRLPLLHDAILEHNDPGSLKYLSDVKSAVGEAHDNLREVMTYFRTRMDPLGLLHALRGVADSFFSRNAIVLEINNAVQDLFLTDEQEVQVFHIVQEALANIAKHSMARHALISIRQIPEHLEFVIEDDGLGMDEPCVSTIVTTAKGMIPSTHFGLDIMQSRAKRLGGSLEVGRNAGAGTRVRLLLPLLVARGEYAA